MRVQRSDMQPVSPSVIPAIAINMKQPEGVALAKQLIARSDVVAENFSARVGNRWMLTPLGVALIVIDVMDLVFAVDSIPAVFAITQDPFIVYTSNICAILGLRSLYFVVARLMDRFVYLRTGLAFVLGFVGLKMIVAKYFPVPTPISLGIIVIILAVTIGISMLKTQNRAATEGRK